MGVALITSMSARVPISASARRCRTPKRCCSSTTTSPSRSNSTLSWISACVPTAIPAPPLAMRYPASRRCFAPIRPVSSVTPTGRPSSSFVSVRACCSARISVGAISAAW
ncbi:hypothetical protein SAMN05216486_11328 [bacterium JGI 053]|nr:hypothetical protein SAMN05216486_11328 [bacterium JGI 053]